MLYHNKYQHFLHIVGTIIGVTMGQFQNVADERPNVVIVNESGFEAATLFTVLTTTVCIMMGVAWYCTRKQMESEMVRLRMEISDLHHQEAEQKPTTRSIAVQSQTSYTWWRQQGRFIPLPEKSHGVFVC